MEEKKAPRVYLAAPRNHIILEGSHNVIVYLYIPIDYFVVVES